MSLASPQKSSEARQEEEELNRLVRTTRESRVEPARRKALSRLIELSRSPHSSVKLLVANNIHSYFRDVPALENDAINVVYDFCEDPEQQVRLQGYSAIAEMSRANKKWVKRNADVLVQLLQTDDPVEVKQVQKSLKAHIDIDPVATFGVFCDQLVPQDEALDAEEQGMRDKLRILVVNYLRTADGRATVNRGVKSKDANTVLVTGLLKAVAQLPPAEVDTIVRDLLLPLPCYTANSSDCRTLLQAIIDRARSTLKADLSTSDSPASCTLPATQILLALMLYMVQTLRRIPPDDVLEFYCTSLLDIGTLERLTPDTRFSVTSDAISYVPSTQSEPQQDSPETKKLRGLLVNTGPSVFKILIVSLPTDSRWWMLSETFLKQCKQAKLGSNWIPSEAAVDEMHKLEALVPTLAPHLNINSQVILDLIRSLLPPAPPSKQQPPQTPISGKGGKGSASSANGSKATVRPLIKRPAGNSAPMQTTSLSRPSTPKRPGTPMTVEPTTDDARPVKRARPQSQPPSLLTRIVSNAPGAKTPNSAAPRRRDGSLGEDVDQGMDVDRSIKGGWSIKGAAQRHDDTEHGPGAGSNAGGAGGLLGRLAKPRPSLEQRVAGPRGRQKAGR